MLLHGRLSVKMAVVVLETTMGHFYANWEKPEFRKLMLNAIVWTAGIDVPTDGVNARFYNDDEVTQLLFGKQKKGLNFNRQQSSCT